jgi:hypothetical protein
VIAGHVQVARDGIAPRCIAVVARHVRVETRTGYTGDDVVLLPALPAEPKREERLLAVVWNTELILPGDVPDALRLEAHMDRVTLGHELV